LGTDERAGRISADDANAARDRVGHDIKNLTELIGKIETQEKNFEQAGQQSGQRSTDYAREITEMKRNIAALTQQRDALNAALSSSQQS
jgi:ferritin-like metal-binding protein YciE